MPIQLRAASGEPHGITQPCAIEVTDDAGRIAVVIVQSPGGSVSILTPGSPAFKNHLTAVGAKPSTVHIHDDTDNPPRKRQ
jgi:hypothetical protein